MRVSYISAEIELDDGNSAVIYVSQDGYSISGVDAATAADLGPLAKGICDAAAAYFQEDDETA